MYVETRRAPRARHRRPRRQRGIDSFFLAQDGFAVETAADGETGVDLAHEGFDVIVMDLTMPKLARVDVGRRAANAKRGLRARQRDERVGHRGLAYGERHAADSR